VNDLAERVQRVGSQMGLNVILNSVPNPRVELEDHYYNAVHTKLLDLGLQPHLLDDAEVERMIRLTVAHQDRIDRRLIMPTVNWRKAENVVEPTAETVTNHR
jgi:UDP-sulfoquinovose synthase